MLKRFTVTLLIFTIILSFIQFYGEEGNASAIKDFSFKQEISIPIDTSLEMAKFQPVDMRINFENPCWAKNETVRSVRVYYDNGYGFTEIESQIYDLDFIDDAHIRACSLVFLIPPEANGKEKYYVLYDESETPPPQYTDHVSIEDTHYFYEPISGQKIDFDYYKIIQDGYVIYGICQKGILLGNGVSHLVVKLKPNSTEFETVNADQFASFSMTYGTDDIKGEAGTDWATEISKNIIVDGNLMVRVRIKSISPERNLKTDNIYTYYYSPVAVKRLDANVNHEVLQTIEIKGNIERDGTYAHLSTFKSRSATIDKMNVGVILPSLHVYGEDSIIKEYSIPPDPSSEKEEWILSTRDDCDIGKKAWICLDDPATGKTHGFIFQSNTGFLKENDGLQVKTSVQQVVKLPGLEADAGSVFVARNTYEKGGKHDTTLPEGMNLTFNAEFITFEKGGYEAVDAESQIYQKMVPYKPIFRGNVSHEEKEEKYNLTAYVHIAPSFPLGSALSAVLGKNFSYLYAEVYKENSLASSGSVSRLPLSEGMELEFENTTLIQKIKIILGLFDWKNFSLTKKIIFPGLDKGRYLLKVYKENPLFRKERQYIGFKAVDVENDVSTHIFCRPEGVAMFSIVNQNGEGIKDAKFFLIKDNITVAEEISDENGSVLLKAPYHSFSPYNLKIFYKGFLRVSS
ncbi:MAG TPA: hypothetical protein ENI33_00090 [Thermoplasmatales archaeon]|nr:hypothetical protein [Thermoplasmatales archaeon]